MIRREFLGAGAMVATGGLAFDIQAALALSEGTLSSDVPRYALVIGNGAYQQLQPLDNPTNDARAIAGVLRELKFDVDYVENASLGSMETLVHGLRGNAAEGGVTLAFYAGHAVQYRGVNYLLPVDAAVEAPHELPTSAVALDAFLESASAARSALGIFIVDACRDNPFGDLSDALGSGLAAVRGTESETFIAYAAAVGAVAFDSGGGKNSPFTAALVAALEYPDRDIFDVFREVRGRVREATDGRQLPWLSTSLERSFIFRPSNIQSSAFHVTRYGISEEAVFWQAIVPSKEKQDFAKYLELFPEGEFVEDARARILELDASELPILPQPAVKLIAESKAGVTPCDLVAADPFDANRTADGVVNGLVNTRLAVRLCTEALSKEPENPRLSFQLGRILSLREQWDEAEHYLVRAGNKGYAIAFSARASIYHLGYGRPQDFELAAHLYGQAARLGDIVGQFRLGKLHQEGWGVEQSYERALDWYNKAALASYPPALDSLGSMYRSGLGVEQDFIAAAEHYRKGAQHGSSNALDNLAKLYRSGDGVPEDMGEAVRLFTLAIERGNIFSPAQLARMYRKGWGVKQDLNKARELFDLSAQRGFAGAWLRLGEMHQKGESVPADPGEAYFHYLVAQKIALERRQNDPVFAESRSRAEEMARLVPASLRREQERRADRWVALNGQPLRYARHAFQ